jgi:phosphoribosylformylglycinamidine cyclo-ligase
MAKKKVSYKDSGVDIDKANSFVEQIRPFIKATSRKEVLGTIGSYGGLFHLNAVKYRNPVLVSSTDGVGTKLKISQMMNRHDTIGIDLVAMNTNDLVVQGAEPLFFLDYIATGHLDVDTSVQIVEGIAQGCIESGCALIGGETAEMPGVYGNNDYDLAGFCVGIVEREKLIDGSEIRVGDQIIGLASSGMHSNGFSLVRKVLFDIAQLTVNDRVEGLDHTIGEELLRPTRIYVKSILNLVKSFTVKGIIHITGGGFMDNIPRIIPEPCKAVIRKDSWEVPPIFTIIQERGNIDYREMVRVFNMGIGIMLIVPEKETADIMERLEALGETAYLIGSVDKRDKNKPSVSFE